MVINIWVPGVASKSIYLNIIHKLFPYLNCALSRHHSLSNS